MPVKSKAQERYMYAKHPEIAKRWQAEYGQPKSLPKHVNKARTVKTTVKTTPPSPTNDRILDKPSKKRRKKPYPDRVRGWYGAGGPQWS